MKTLTYRFSQLLLVASLLVAWSALGTTSAQAAATLRQKVEPAEISIGDPVGLTITVQNGTIRGRNSSSFMGMSVSTPDITFPEVDGLQPAGKSLSTEWNNGKVSTVITYIFVPTRAGDFTIPSFDIPLKDGSTLRSQPAKIHVLADAPSSMSPPLPPPPGGLPPPGSAQANDPVAQPQPFNPNGPVVMPPGGVPNSPDQPETADAVNNSTIPREPSGRPAKVFMIITPQTTDAYVGQIIPMKIEFYLRLDVIAQQDSLPTIKGSDFLMNNLSGRPMEERLEVMGEGYQRETWITAISAPKSGDFSLQMKRDTYWVKSNGNSNMDPFGNFFFNRPNLAHEPVPSNQLMIHVHSLPDEGRPVNFSGAIGHLQVSGTAEPPTVAVGEPVTLRFNVTGEANFGYVHCPALADDPAWKTYVASSKIQYQDQSRTQGTKTFEQAIIPQKNGTLPLPQATFSYFDPTAKKYIIVPIALPSINVTGTMPAKPVAVTATSTDGEGSSKDAAPVPPGMLPNRTHLGALRTDLTPVYHRLWFWVVEGGFVAALLGAGLFTLLRPRAKIDVDQKGRAERQQTLHREQDAMGEAVHQGNAQAFFLAARHALQLHLGTQWNVRPEAITLGEIRQRDPQLAETLEPLFAQVDEVIYSGQASSNLDLAAWEARVREWLKLKLQLQPV